VRKKGEILTVYTIHNSGYDTCFIAILHDDTVLIAATTNLSSHIPGALHLFIVMLRVDFFEERFLDDSLLLRNLSVKIL